MEEMDVVDRMKVFLNQRNNNSEELFLAYEENIRVLRELMDEIAEKNPKKFNSREDVEKFFEEAYFSHRTLVPLFKIIRKTIGGRRLNELLEKS